MAEDKSDAKGPGDSVVNVLEDILVIDNEFDDEVNDSSAPENKTGKKPSKPPVKKPSKSAVSRTANSKSTKDVKTKKTVKEVKSSGQKSATGKPTPSNKSPGSAKAVAAKAGEKKGVKKTVSAKPKTDKKEPEKSKQIEKEKKKLESIKAEHEKNLEKLKVEEKEMKKKQNLVKSASSGKTNDGSSAGQQKSTVSKAKQSVIEKKPDSAKRVKKVVPAKKVLKKSDDKEVGKDKQSQEAMEVDAKTEISLEKTVEEKAEDSKHDTVAMEDKLNVTVEEDIGQEETTISHDLEEFDTRSEAGSSSSGGSSRSVSRSRSRSKSGSRSRSRSASGSSASDSGSEGRRKRERRRRRKRRHISPIVFDKSQRNESGSEGSHKISTVSSSVKQISKDQSSKLKYLFRDARYFLIKSNNHENIALAKAKGVWSTPPNNEQRINQAFRDARNVILIFSVKESGKFQGYARVAGESRRDGPTVNWVLPPGLSKAALGGVFSVDWITRQELPFIRTSQLYNPWNENKPVKIGRDGQEIEPKAGYALCQMFPRDDNIDISSIVRRARRQDSRSRRDHDSSSSSRRRRVREDFSEPRRKRRRDEYSREGYSHRSDRRGYIGVRREVMINGVSSYMDYMREFHVSSRPPPMPMNPYSDMRPYGMDGPPHYLHQGPPPPVPRHMDPYPLPPPPPPPRSRDRDRDRDRGRDRDRDRDRRLSYDSRSHAVACDDFVRRTQGGESRRSSGSSSSRYSRR
ncbi:YTH domain-containing protein 1-like isoform X3 [Ptychodera flava]|uniref:YTH domain-containing protein 1-like isoform X3 n=1 Tax=Ptychodera flava TaxID=63121 RepID=UPI00396AA993